MMLIVDSLPSNTPSQSTRPQNVQPQNKNTLSQKMQAQNTDTDKKLYYFAFKNNLLYDVALLPNLTVEAYLGNQLSLAIEGNWSWWSSDRTIKSDWYHRIQSVGVELRYWINSPFPLHGHAVGVYSMVGDYDVRFFAKNENSKGSLSYGSWSTGLSYGYSMPIASRLNMEFGLALGYLGGKYYDYNYSMERERWEQQGVYNRKYVGITRAGVSIVWMFGSGNNKKNIGEYGKNILRIEDLNETF